MALPNGLEWLQNEDGPLMIKEALKLHGTQETPDSANNLIIMGWAAELGESVSKIYLADEIPWCGLFMAIVAKRAKKKVVIDPLWALNWGTFGKLSETPMFGDVLVFTRKTEDGKTAGHVGLYVGEEEKYFYVLGGNQSDCVCIRRIPKKRLYMCRRPNYNIQPKNVRKIELNLNIPIALDVVLS